MALISQIRKHGSWIMIIMIALGVGGFILMDMTVGQTSLFGGAQPTLGKVGSTKIKVQEFTNIESILGAAADPLARRNSLWDFLVQDILLKDEAQKLGIAVSSTELTDLQYGPEPSSIIMQRFTDPNTGMLNREQINQIRQAVEQGTAEPSLKSFWKFQEREITSDRIQTKLSALVSKGLYTPTWVAEQINREQTEQYNILYVKVPFEALDNSDVALSDADYEAYIKENAGSLKQKEALRKIQYVSFEVRASSADSSAVRTSLQELAAEFGSTDNDTMFIEQNLGTLDKAFLKKEELPAAYADSMLAQPVGAVFGPYQDGNSYRITKILDRKVVADSVRSRHILIPAQDQQSLIFAQNRVDSLKKVIEEGKGTFAELAQKFGTDGSASEGGDLKFAAAGTMVKPFNDLIFYEAEQGKLYTVITEFGVHLVEVTDKKFINNTSGIRVATISKPIYPSEDTRNAAYDKALSIVTNAKTLSDLESIAKKRKLELETAPAVTANDFTLGSLGGSQQSRDIIKWAFSADKGEVSSVIYVFSDPVENYDNRYVVAAVASIQPAGLPKLEDIKSDIEPIVLNRKKGELISQKLKGKSLSQAAGVYNTPVDTLNGLNFAMKFIPELGSEPRLLGKVSSMEKGSTSEPIVGTGGVYVAQLLSKTVPVELPNIADMRSLMSATARSQASATLLEGIKSTAKIKDYRAKFF